MKKFLTQAMLLSAMMIVVFSMSITAYAGTAGENKQTVKLFDLLDGELSEYGADIKNWLSEELSKEENEGLVEEVLEFVRQKLEAGELETDEDIYNAIEEGEEKFDIRLTKEQKDKIVQLTQKIRKMGLDPENLLEQAQSLYEQYGNELFENTEEVLKKSVQNSVKGFFKDMGNRLKGFFTNIFS